MMNVATHCKVQCGNEFRRFLLPTSKYEDLANQIRSLFGFEALESLTLKYTDEEGDMVTISSDEELKFAIGLFAGGLLRLTICNPKNRGGKKGCERNWDSEKKWNHEKKWNQENMESKGAMWKKKWETKLLNNPQLLQKKIDQFIGKQDNLRKRLQWLESKSVGNPNPSFPHRIAHIQMKLQRIENGLSHLQSLQKGSGQNNLQSPPPSAPPQEPIVQSPTPGIESESSEEDSLKQWKKAIWAKKAEMRTLREGARAGTITKADASLKIFTLKEEIGKIRAEHREKMAACKKHKETANLM